jgi:hypothetical protein
MLSSMGELARDKGRSLSDHCEIERAIEATIELFRNNGKEFM